jgi:hypothetical protein
MSNEQNGIPMEPSQTPGIRIVRVGDAGIENVRDNAIDLHGDDETGSVVKKVESLPESEGEETEEEERDGE